MSFSIEADWEKLSLGAPEDRACFSALGIKSHGIWLTQAEDVLVRRIRDKVYLSAYRLAEWCAWNWWRLRWEPRTQSRDWALSHKMTTIGGGYIWPNITIISDSERIVLVAKPTEQQPQEPLRYIRDLPAVVRAVEFENTLDLFLEQVRGQLISESVKHTNFERIWDDVLAERNDPEATQRRRLEALLGCDPDESDNSILEKLVLDSEALGQQAMIEITADHHDDRCVVTAEQISEIANASGFEMALQNSVTLQNDTQLPGIGDVPAWRRGAEAAKALRKQQRLDTDMITNASLADMAGVVSNALEDKKIGPDFSFALVNSGCAGRVVLRSKWLEGRRFQLARILGDRLISDDDGRLNPATRTYTYRQKMQRSFAAEFLCPFDALEDTLAGDYSSEAIEDASKHYVVSERTVRTLLVNHGCLEREGIEGDFETLTAA